MTLAKGMPVALFAMVLRALAAMYWQTTGKTMALLHPPLDPRFWVLTAVGLLCYQLLAAVLMLRQRAMLDGGVPDFKREAAAALRCWPMLISTYILGGIAVFVGTLLLIGPGVFLLVCFLLMRPVVLFESAGPLQMLVRCVQLVRGAWAKVLASAIIAGLIFVVCVIAAAACLGILNVVAVGLGAPAAAMNAIASACELGVWAVALVYFSALWLVLYSAASSSA